MTFIDGSSDTPNTVPFTVCFAILSALFCVTMIQAIYECNRPIYNKHTVRFLLPWASFCSMVENATLAVESRVPQAWADVVYALQATVAPSLLLSSFDVTYIIHKTRHLQFCGIMEGQTHRKNPRVARAVKWSIRLLALGLLVLELLMNFDVGFTPPSPAAGRVGWYYVVTEPFSTQQIQVVLGLIPMAIVALCCLYFSLLLWKYGTKSSMVVHSSPLNPWFSPLFGVLALIVGQWFGSKLFLLLSNVGIFVFFVSILFLVLEVNKDLRAAVELNVFLGAFDDLRQFEEKHQEEFEQQQDTEEEEQVTTDFVRSAVSTGDQEVKRDSKGEVVGVDEDRIRIKKGKVVGFVEEDTEIEP